MGAFQFLKSEAEEYFRVTRGRRRVRRQSRRWAFSPSLHRLCEEWAAKVEENRGEPPSEEEIVDYARGVVAAANEPPPLPLSSAGEEEPPLDGTGMIFTGEDEAGMGADVEGTIDAGGAPHSEEGVVADALESLEGEGLSAPLDSDADALAPLPDGVDVTVVGEDDISDHGAVDVEDDDDGDDDDEDDYDNGDYSDLLRF